jgi:hypothetical protein
MNFYFDRKLFGQYVILKFGTNYKFLSKNCISKLH